MTWQVFRDSRRDPNRRRFENALGCNAAQSGLEVLKVDRLDHVMGEAAIEGTGNVLGHAKSAEERQGEISAFVVPPTLSFCAFSTSGWAVHFEELYPA